MSGEKRRSDGVTETSSLLKEKPRQRPTLAQAIQALPSATQRLTAEFGMGSGRTTALMSPGKTLFSRCSLKYMHS